MDSASRVPIYAALPSARDLVPETENKRLIIKHFPDQGDDLHIADAQGDDVKDLSHFNRASTIVCYNGSDTSAFHKVLFDNTLPVGLSYGERVSLTIMYGKPYVFRDEQSFSRWNCQDRTRMRGASAAMVIPLNFSNST